MVALAGAPKISMPDQEEAWLREEYARAEVILEYGSGGSTALAQSLGKRVFSVESDAEWLKSLSEALAGDGPMDKLHLHHADIGPTGDWGMPLPKPPFTRFPDYPLSVWERPDFVQPDLALIDGRFRPACLLACLFLTKAPMRVLFDDYTDRPIYKVVEDFVKPAETRGRMARFEISPQTINPGDLRRIASLMVTPK
ncbi:hypothetical protein [Pseudoroseicyclus sp. CXY001]|uniref:hypothetical protein n=1 Tax=Pseudoroseicyclus sp. CXY001 TaxID=3242492 RepID=UPI003570C94D